MVSEIVIPILDQTTTEVRLITWHVNEGDAVIKGQVICEIETDKATVEIESSNDGLLRKILIEPDTTIPPLTVVALVGGQDDPVPDIDPYYRAKPSQPEDVIEPPTPAVSTDKDKARIKRKKPASSPRARRLADEHNIDITSIVGSGPQGRILEDDVRQVLKEEPDPDLSRSAHATAERVSLSWNTIPHFYTSATIDMSSVVALQTEMGVGYTYTDFIALAIAEAVNSQPSINGHWTNGTPDIISETHLGLVVQTQQSLVIPTLRDLHNHNLKEIAAERAKLVQQAHDGKLSTSAMTPATFTLSNLGPGHIDHFTAIISPPQLAILSVGSILKRPLVVNDELAARPSATFTLGVDHRAIDGRAAAGFLEALKTALEQET